MHTLLARCKTHAHYPLHVMPSNNYMRCSIFLRHTASRAQDGVNMSLDRVKLMP